MTNTELQVKHTPAPWKIHKTPNDPDFTHEIFGVCSVYVGENSEANARLIAAAPELLEALQNIVIDYTPKDGSDKRALEAAKSAIAKALGEQA